jgi:hypothetical protein
MDETIKTVWQCIKARDFSRARALAADIRDPKRQQGAYRVIRQQQIQAIRDLWAELHRRGAYTPPDDLTLNLDDPEADDLISDDRIDALFAAAAVRLVQRDPDLPPRWEWAGRWWGRRDDGEETAIFAERKDALRAMRAKLSEHERTMLRRRRRRLPSADDELFPEEQKGAA